MTPHKTPPGGGVFAWGDMVWHVSGVGLRCARCVACAVSRCVSCRRLRHGDEVWRGGRCIAWRVGVAVDTVGVRLPHGHGEEDARKVDDGGECHRADDEA